VHPTKINIIDEITVNVLMSFIFKFIINIILIGAAFYIGAKRSLV